MISLIKNFIGAVGTIFKSNRNYSPSLINFGGNHSIHNNYQIAIDGAKPEDLPKILASIQPNPQRDLQISLSDNVKIDEQLATSVFRAVSGDEALEIVTRLRGEAPYNSIHNANATISGTGHILKAEWREN